MARMTDLYVYIWEVLDAHCDAKWGINAMTR
jgi:hypothetical protein